MTLDVEGEAAAAAWGQGSAQDADRGGDPHELGGSGCLGRPAGRRGRRGDQYDSDERQDEPGTEPEAVAFEFGLALAGVRSGPAAARGAADAVRRCWFLLVPGLTAHVVDHPLEDLEGAYVLVVRGAGVDGVPVRPLPLGGPGLEFVARVRDPQ